MSERAVTTVQEAYAVADWLATIGQHKRAEDVRRVCRQNSSYRETCSRLHTENAHLREQLDARIRAGRPHPPLRSTVGEPGYDHEVSMRTEILFDGQPASKVISYDCEAGTLTRFVTDAVGKIQLNEGRADARRETLSGKVEVRWKERNHG